jgi:hypothetical protein
LSTAIASKGTEAEALELALLGDDLSRLTPPQRLYFYNRTCESLGLNPLTKPFSYLQLSGKLTLYAKRDCTDQLRKIHGVSVTDLTDYTDGEGTYVVTAKGRDRDGRVDASKGAVFLGQMKGEMRANAIMKAETKAKRRLTLSLCGLGMLDETEVDLPAAVLRDTDVMHSEPTRDAQKERAVASPSAIGAVQHPPSAEPAREPQSEAELVTESENLFPTPDEIRDPLIKRIEKFTPSKIKVALHRVLSVDPETDWRKMDVAAMDMLARHLEVKKSDDLHL